MAAELLGLPLDRVHFDLGDSDMPWSPASGGSGLTASLGNAVYAACHALLQQFLNAAANDERSPLRGCSADDVSVAAGHIHRRDDPSVGENYSDILTRHGLDELTADGKPHRLTRSTTSSRCPDRSRPSSSRSASTKISGSSASRA